MQNYTQPTMYDQVNFDIYINMCHVQAQLQWQGTVIVPMVKGKFCTFPEPKLRYQ